jgi:hypothetical protein
MSKKRRLEKRYAWIEASLRYAGKFDKVSYGRHFDINPPQISADQSGFVNEVNRKLNRENRRLNGSDVLDIDWVSVAKGKILVVQKLPEKPVFSILPLRDWLHTMEAIPYVRIYDLTPVDPNPVVLRSICDAILNKRPINVSLPVGKGRHGWRNISPHTIFDADGRLYIRAYDHLSDAFDEFVIASISDTGPHERGIQHIAMEKDADWIENASLTIEADIEGPGDFTDEAISDFGLDPKLMTRKISVPRALLYHVETRIRCRVSQIASRVGLVHVSVNPGSSDH